MMSKTTLLLAIPLTVWMAMGAPDENSDHKGIKQAAGLPGIHAKQNRVRQLKVSDKFRDCRHFDSKDVGEQPGRECT